MNIIFMGTPDFAKESLEKIYNAGHNIVAVVTNPDKPKGRGMKVIASPVKEFAVKKNIKVFQPLKIKNNEEFIGEIKSLNPDLMVVVAYGKILPKEVLDIPKYGAINVHGSILPKYRGAAPIQWAVLNGDKETGITTMFMDLEMDAGDIILTEKVEIDDDETTGELWNRLSIIGGELLVKTVDLIENSVKTIEETSDENLLEKIKKKVGAKKQPENYSLAPMLSKEMSKIDWTKSAREIHNLVRGLDPIMGAYSMCDGKKIKFWKVNVVDYDNKTNKPGEILTCSKKEGLKIQTGNGIIEVIEIQGENAKRMDIKSFLNGTQIKVGTILQ